MAPAHRPTAAARSRGKLAAALGLTLAFLVVEVAGAWWTGSLALLADAGHMLTDAGGLALALLAIACGNIGTLMLAYGGGGHKNAGTCQVANQDVERVLGELIGKITADG